MPIDANRYASSNNYSDRYASKTQDIAPEPQARQGSWQQTPASSWSQTPGTSHSSNAYSVYSGPNSSPSTALVDKKPISGLSASKQQELDRAMKTRDSLQKLPNDFPIRSLTRDEYQSPIELLDRKINRLANSTDSKNPVTKFSNHLENKKEEKELNREMASLYKKARDIQHNGTNPTDKNRASNVTDTLTSLGREQPWFKDIRKENRADK
ncbi:hypothetical protein [Pseudomonas sp. TH31]|uniref:hypothetical protein n=1 Tax=Pseudomonas sp. TH31 TaxID=2796396 RepID=UPI0019142DD7|nr:hypothetical protein [Pseudomonas sp. TH31]MBK5414738.1 hypothetical protein [Pseudomonas sp. TH31]